MKRLFAMHSLRWIAAIFVAALAGWFLLRFVVNGWNNRLTVNDLPDRPYAESVAVEPGSPLFFTWGVTAGPRTKAIGQQNLPDEERYGDTYIQAHSVLSTLMADLREVGLTLRDVVNVRAYVVGNETEPPDFAAWDRAFRDYFGTPHMPHKPARTTLGISRLFLPAYKIEVEFTAAFPSGRGPFETGSKAFREYDRLNRVETSDAWKSYGRPRFPMSTGKAIRGGDVLYFSSAVLPKPMNPTMAKQYWMFGPIANQASSIFQQTQASLSRAGIEYPDLFFVRTIMFPEGEKPIGGNFAVFNQEYNKFLNNDHNPNRPTRTVMSAPGFTYRKQLMAVEMYGLLPASESTIDFAGAPLKAFENSDTLGSSGVAVAPESGLEFFSGVIALQPHEDLADETRAVLDAIDTKLSARALDRSHIISLRAYLVGGHNPSAAVAAWESSYAEWFGTEMQPHEPALTTMPIVALPGDRKIEVEILVAVPVEE